MSTPRASGGQEVVIVFVWSVGCREELKYVGRDFHTGVFAAMGKESVMEGK